MSIILNQASFQFDLFEPIQIDRMVKPEMFLQEGRSSSSEEAKQMMRTARQSSGPSSSSSSGPAEDSSKQPAKRQTAARKGKAKNPSFLPLDFKPGPHSVVIGRNRDSKNAAGSKRLKTIAAGLLQEYADANTKPEKSEIVTRIFNMIEEVCPSGGFVKFSQEHGRWIRATASSAREKIGYVFRDLLADRYRSSSKSKMARRRKRMEEESKSRASSPSSMTTSGADRETEDDRKPAASTTRGRSRRQQQAPVDPVLQPNHIDRQELFPTDGLQTSSNRGVPSEIGYHQSSVAAAYPQLSSSFSNDHLHPLPLSSYPHQPFPAGTAPFLHSPVQRSRTGHHRTVHSSDAANRSTARNDRSTSSNHFDGLENSRLLAEDFSVADPFEDGDISNVFE